MIDFRGTFGQRIRRGALELARSDPGGRLVAAVAHRRPELLPGKIAVLDDVVIFRHPSPSAPGHLLAVPRRPIADALAEDAAAAGFWDGLAGWLLSDQAAQPLRAGVTNVGDRQDVALLHVHLLRDLPGWMSGPGRWTGDTLSEAFGSVRAADHGEAPTASFGFMINSPVPVAPRWRIFCST